MGAPTAAAKPRKRAAAGKKGPTPPRVRDLGDVEKFTDEDMARLEAEIDAEIKTESGPIGQDGEIRPVEIGKAGRPGDDMEHIFTLDGEKYYVPKRPPVRIMLRFMREIRDKRVGRDEAVENAMLAMLGKHKLDLLCESDEVTDDNFADVMTIVGYILFTAIRRFRERTDATLDPSSRAQPS